MICTVFVKVKYFTGCFKRTSRYYEDLFNRQPLICCLKINLAGNITYSQLHTRFHIPLIVNVKFGDDPRAIKPEPIIHIQKQSLEVFSKKRFY